MKGRVLIVAGSDSGGGAGIQADIKTVTALGGYAATAVTALTAQDTRGVHGIVDVAPDFVAEQMNVVLDDIGADGIKTGMLRTAGIISAVATAIEQKTAGIPVVVDPVMTAKSGDSLLEVEARQALRALLILRATVLTPNIPEAEILTGMSIATSGDMVHAAAMLLTLGPKYVLLTGGHLMGPIVHDVLIWENDIKEFSSPRIDTQHTHGTGCTLASGIVTGLAQGMDVVAAVARARAYVAEAIRTAPAFGAGHGPLNHGHTVAPFWE